MKNDKYLHFWLYLINMIISSFMHFFCKWYNLVLLYGRKGFFVFVNHIFLILPSVGHTGHFHNLATENKSVIKYLYARMLVMCLLGIVSVNTQESFS